MTTPPPTNLYITIGGQPAVAVVVDALYERLVADPLVRHHFAPERLESLKAAQCAWFAAALSGSSELPSDLASTHAHLDITDAEVAAVLGHLESILAGTALSLRVRRAIMATVSRLWHARRF
jgi:truncated hemoglobin YjbI